MVGILECNGWKTRAVWLEDKIAVAGTLEHVVGILECSVVGRLERCDWKTRAQWLED